MSNERLYRELVGRAHWCGQQSGDAWSNDDSRTGSLPFVDEGQDCIIRVEP
jgi:hypothetical protein